MKRIAMLLALVLCLSLLLSACAKDEMKDESKTDPTTAVQTTADPEPTQQPTEPEQPTEPAPMVDLNTAYSGYDYILAPNALGIMLNEPLSDSAPEPSETWLDGEYERAYIIPRFLGTVVELYAVTIDDEGATQIAAEPAYRTVTEDGCVIYGSFPRPEGMPIYYLKLTAPDGTVFGMELGFNGRTGTPPTQYLCDTLESEEAEAVMTDLLGTEEYSWGVEEACSIVEGVPYVNFRVMRLVTDDAGSHTSYACNALLAPNGSAFAAELDVDTDQWKIIGDLQEAING